MGHFNSLTIAFIALWMMGMPVGGIEFADDAAAQAAPNQKADADDLFGDPKPKDDKQADADDLFGGQPNQPAAPKPADPPAAQPAAAPSDKPADPTGAQAHAKIFAEDEYPSANKCAVCHQQIYDEWRVSNHAYASISPMFHKFEQRINELAGGTVNYFCLRCHASVGTTLKERRDLPLWERAKTSREGVTCITCHRVKEEYIKANGERRIEPGPIFAPMYGTKKDGSYAKFVEENKGVIKQEPRPGPGVEIHAEAIEFATLNKSEFCVSCHQVAVYPGIKLEVVWDQYRASPAFEKGITCQQCHMGKVPGVPAGYEKGPAAIVNGKPTNPERQHSNHSFYGPGYPIAHPGIFPHNLKADDKAEKNGWTIDKWLKFDYRAKWGSQEFEDKVANGEIKIEFPKEWADEFDRGDAWEIIKENIALLEVKRKHRLAVMENGSRIDGPFFGSAPAAGNKLSFYYEVTNTDEGHNLPSGSLGAQPEIWLNVALVGPDGKNLWESGYVDKYGDMADIHSLEVAAGTIKYDDQLNNFQTKFLTTNVKGTDREMYLPINLDIDQLPFIRPAGQPITVMNHPPFVRMEGRSLPPLASRKMRYSVPADLMSKPGKYKLAVRMRSRAEPIYFMKFVRATVEMEQSMNEWMIDIHPYTVEFEVK